MGELGGEEGIIERCGSEEVEGGALVGSCCRERWGGLGVDRVVKRGWADLGVLRVCLAIVSKGLVGRVCMWDGWAARHVGGS